MLQFRDNSPWECRAVIPDLILPISCSVAPGNLVQLWASEKTGDTSLPKAPIT